MFINWSIRRRLVAAVTAVAALLLLIVVLLILSAVSDIVGRQTQTALTERNGRMAELVNAQLQSVDAITDTMTSALAHSAVSPVSVLWKSASAILRDPETDYLQRVVVIRPYRDGYETILFRQPPAPQEIAPLSMYYGSAFPDDASFVSQLPAGQVTWLWRQRGFRALSDEAVIAAASPIEGGGVLWLEFPASQVAGWLQTAVGDDRTPYQLLVSNADSVLASFNPARSDLKLPLLKSDLAPVFTNDDGSLQTVTSSLLNGKSSYVNHSDLLPSGWQLTSVIPVDTVQNSFSERALQVLFIAVFGLAVLAWWIDQLGGSTITRPLTDLTITAQEIGSGDMRYQIGYRDQDDEVGKLARALEDMKLNLAHSYETLSLWGRTLEKRVAERTTELEVARAEALTTANDLRAVYDASLSVVSEYYLQIILQTLVERVRGLLRASYAGIWLVTPDKQQLQMVATTAEDRSVIGLLIDIDQGLAGTVIHDRVPLRLDSYQEWEGRLGLLAPDIDRALAIPLIFSGDIIGAVVAGRLADAPVFTEEDQRLLTLLANLVSPVVRNGQLFGQLDAAVKEAERANMVKTRFLASVTHELRTPLNLIINNMDFMRIGTFGEVNDDQRGRLDQTIRSAEHLLYLINDLLDVSKIEAGEMQLFIQPNDLHPVIEDALDSTMAVMDGSKPVALNVHIPEHLPTVQMDARRVRQVLLNLLSNAVKFTQEGEVTLTIEALPDQVRFTVSDTGIGIPPDELANIFEAFERSTRAKAMGIEGTGLGLPISRYLVQAHGGDMTVATEMGQGTTFSFTLPLTQPTEQPKENRASISGVLGHKSLTAGD